MYFAMSKLVSFMKIFSFGNISYQKICHEYGGCSKVCLASGSEILTRLRVKKFCQDKESFYRIVLPVVMHFLFDKRSGTAL